MKPLTLSTLFALVLTACGGGEAPTPTDVEGHAATATEEAAAPEEAADPEEGEADEADEAEGEEADDDADEGDEAAHAGPHGAETVGTMERPSDDEAAGTMTRPDADAADDGVMKRPTAAKKGETATKGMKRPE